MVDIAVNQARLSLHFTHADQHQTLQQRITREFRRVLQRFDLSAITDELDGQVESASQLKIAGEAENQRFNLTIEYIQLDLGELNLSNLEQQFSQQLTRQLQQELTKAIAQLLKERLYLSSKAQQTTVSVNPAKHIGRLSDKSHHLELQAKAQVNGVISSVVKRLRIILAQLQQHPGVSVVAAKQLAQWLAVEYEAGSTVKHCQRQARLDAVVSELTVVKNDRVCQQWQLQLLQSLAQAPSLPIPVHWLPLAKHWQQQLVASKERFALALAWYRFWLVLCLAAVEVPMLAKWLSPRRKIWQRRITTLATGLSVAQPLVMAELEQVINGYQQLYYQQARCLRLQQALQQSVTELQASSYWIALFRKLQKRIPTLVKHYPALWQSLDQLAKCCIAANGQQVAEDVVRLQQQVLSQLTQLMSELKQGIQQLHRQWQQVLLSAEQPMLASLLKPLQASPLCYWLEESVTEKRVEHSLPISKMKTGYVEGEKTALKPRVNVLPSDVLNNKTQPLTPNPKILNPDFNTETGKVDELTKPLQKGIIDQTCYSVSRAKKPEVQSLINQLTKVCDKLEVLSKSDKSTKLNSNFSSEKPGVLVAQTSNLNSHEKYADALVDMDIWVTEYSGSVLLWPLLPTLFADLLTEDKKYFKYELAQQRAFFRLWLAMHPAQWLPLMDVHSGSDNQLTDSAAFTALIEQASAIHDPLLILLVGLTPEAVFADSFDLTQVHHDIRHECQQVEQAILAFIQQWAGLKRIELQGLSQLFFNRLGEINMTDNGWQLAVENKPQDVLLQTYPWPQSMIKLPWLEKLLYVNPRTATHHFAYN